MSYVNFLFGGHLWVSTEASWIYLAHHYNVGEIVVN